MLPCYLPEKRKFGTLKFPVLFCRIAGEAKISLEIVPSVTQLIRWLIFFLPANMTLSFALV